VNILDPVTKFLTFIRVIDVHDGQLSLSNVAVMVVLIKLCIAPAASLVDTGTLFVALGNYAYKKYVNSDAAAPDDTVSPQIDEMKKSLEETQSQVTALSISLGIKKL
jgi:hypothetical protein